MPGVRGSWKKKVGEGLAGLEGRWWAWLGRGVAWGEGAPRTPPASPLQPPFPRPSTALPRPQAPNKALASILGKSNLRFAGMSIAVSISTDGLNLSVPATRQVGAAGVVSPMWAGRGRWAQRWAWCHVLTWTPAETHPEPEPGRLMMPRVG